MLEKRIYLWFGNRQVARFVGNTQRGTQIQRELLLKKLRRHASSDFGRDHGFSQIRSLAEFRAQVPVTTYEDYRPYVDRLMRGDVTSMFAPGTRVLMLAMTSGTTNKPKYIPMTQQFIDEYRQGWNLWGVKMYLDHPDLVRK